MEARGREWARILRQGALRSRNRHRYRATQAYSDSAWTYARFLISDMPFDEGRFEQHLENDPRLAFAACWYWIRKLQARISWARLRSGRFAEAKARHSALDITDAI